MGITVGIHVRLHSKESRGRLVPDLWLQHRLGCEQQALNQKMELWQKVLPNSGLCISMQKSEFFGSKQCTGSVLLARKGRREGGGILVPPQRSIQNTTYAPGDTSADKHSIVHVEEEH